jgi:CheY-like chemotaxis protein
MPQLACQDLEKLNVLVVEDNPVNLRLVTRLLEKQGHRTLTATNRREAVEILEKAGWQGIDLALMDLQMPELDGFEATAIIREREKTSGAAVLRLQSNKRVQTKPKKSDPVRLGLVSGRCPGYPAPPARRRTCPQDCN